MIYNHGGDVYAYETRPIDFSSNINPLGLPKLVREVIVEKVDDFSIYPDYSCRILLDSLAREHQVKKEEIVLGNGAAELIYRLCISQKPAKALVMAPSFSEYQQALTLVNTDISYYNLDEDMKMKMDMLERAKGMDMVFICNPNNPTGLLAEETILNTLAESIKNTKTLLVVDECFLDFTDATSMVKQINSNPNIVVIKAFTKFYALAGIRLGYIISSNQKLNEDLTRFAPPWNISAVAQISGVEALKDEDYKKESKVYVKIEREFLLRELEKMNLKVYGGQSNYILFLSEDKNLKEKLLTKGILIRECSNYNNLSDGHYRVAVKSHEDNLKLIKALKEVLNYG
ncbi:MAG: threonine-phosphate decarboxylase CobD [Filifactoraceae bacterium]